MSRDCGHYLGKAETMKFSDGKSYKICRKCANIMRCVAKSEPDNLEFHENITLNHPRRTLPHQSWL